MQRGKYVFILDTSGSVQAMLLTGLPRFIVKSDHCVLFILHNVKKLVHAPSWLHLRGFKKICTCCCFMQVDICSVCDTSSCFGWVESVNHFVMVRTDSIKATILSSSTVKSCASSWLVISSSILGTASGVCFECPHDVRMWLKPGLTAVIFHTTLLGQCYHAK